MFESEAIKGFIFRRKRRPPDCMMPQSDIQMRGEKVSKKEKNSFLKSRIRNLECPIQGICIIGPKKDHPPRPKTSSQAQ